MENVTAAQLVYPSNQIGGRYWDTGYAVHDTQYPTPTLPALAARLETVGTATTIMMTHASTNQQAPAIIILLCMVPLELSLPGRGSRELCDLRSIQI